MLKEDSDIVEKPKYLALAFGTEDIYQITNTEQVFSQGVNQK